jgi:hypothetical protein
MFVHEDATKLFRLDLASRRFYHQPYFRSHHRAVDDRDVTLAQRTPEPSRRAP